MSPQQSRAHCSSANRCSGLGLLCLQRPSHISSISSCSGWRLLHSPFQSWRALAENAIAKKKPPWAALRKNTWDRNENDEATQASAYTSVDGADDDDEPGEPWAAYTTEPTSLASPAGAYYDDGTCVGAAWCQAAAEHVKQFASGRVAAVVGAGSGSQACSVSALRTLSTPLCMLLLCCAVISAH